jgi:hypothetical protein
MSQPKSILFGKGPRRVSRSMSGNPLWPLEELRNVRKPPFVADPEFAPFNTDALLSDHRHVPAPPNNSEQRRPSKHLCQHGIPIPHLVAGLPWRYAQDTGGPVVPERDFVPLDLCKLPVASDR